VFLAAGLSVMQVSELVGSFRRLVCWLPYDEKKKKEKRKSCYK
jgi:hypothetical protein